MATRLRWLGHAAILIETDGKTILIDPFLTGNPAAEGAGIKAKDFTPDAILLSHGHDDHPATCRDRPGGRKAEVASNYEISLWLQKQGLYEGPRLPARRDGEACGRGARCSRSPSTARPCPTATAESPTAAAIRN